MFTDSCKNGNSRSTIGITKEKMILEFLTKWKSNGHSQRLLGPELENRVIPQFVCEKARVYRSVHADVCEETRVYRSGHADVCEDARVYRTGHADVCEKARVYRVCACRCLWGDQSVQGLCMQMSISMVLVVCSCSQKCRCASLSGHQPANLPALSKDIFLFYFFPLKILLCILFNILWT